MQRNQAIDIMKGMAILCVMVGHTYWCPEWLTTIIYSFHIPLFFIISGYFAKVSEDGVPFRTYLQKNCRQLLVPYAIAAVISCAFVIAQSVHYGTYGTIIHEMMKSIFAMDTTWQGTIFDEWVDPTWFLLALFWGRLFFYWLSRVGRWFIPICVILSILMIYAHPYIPTPFCIGRGIEALVFMVIGWAYHKYQFSVWSKLVAIACWLASMYLGTIDVCAYQYNCLPVDVLGTCGGTLIVYYIAKGINKTFLRPFLAWCGRNSLIILCAHSIEMNMTVVHMITKLLPFQLPTMVYFGIKHTVTLCCAWGYALGKKKIVKSE